MSVSISSLVGVLIAAVLSTTISTYSAARAQDVVSPTDTSEKSVFAGANQLTPARAQYFTWINNTNEGPTEAQTLANLEFFGWLKNTYGLQLDIYAFDAGTIDGKRWYGSTASDRFKRQFPNGFRPIYDRASQLGIRLGIWGGPDGFSTTTVDAQARIDMMASLCEDYDFALFKFDRVAGQLRDEKQSEFVELMTRCREAVPDLILLNHRLNLGPGALQHATTSLWERQESYIDVNLLNSTTAKHHRQGALSRGVPPALNRLVEDHGVCLSSALDYWDDELVLQAFNRSLILSPQIYCNPWLLRDDEYPKLARIFNIARLHRNLLVDGIELPMEEYGLSAVSRGNGATRLLTLRNLSWTPVTYELQLDETIGLDATASDIQVRRYHPTETVLGDFEYGDRVNVSVPPFRSALFHASTTSSFGLSGIDYEVIRSLPGQPIELLLVGAPGQISNVTIEGQKAPARLRVDGETLQQSGNQFVVDFQGQPLTQPTHRKIGELKPIAMPADAEALYEATVFAADNNALEVRSLERSGATNIPAVRNARDAFFQQPLFVERGVSDRYLFDDDPDSAFYVMRRWGALSFTSRDPVVNSGGFRLDLGRVEHVDQFILTTRDEFTLQTLKSGEGVVAEVSADLRTWAPVNFLAGHEMRIQIPTNVHGIRYLRILSEYPHFLTDVRAHRNGINLDRSLWRASNLFSPFVELDFSKAWSLHAELAEIAPDSYIAVAINGDSGVEGAYAAMRVGDNLLGAPDRAPSFPANTWQTVVGSTTGNYTYFFPFDKSLEHVPFEIIVLGHQRASEAKIEAWITRFPAPLATKRLTIPQTR